MPDINQLKKGTLVAGLIAITVVILMAVLIGMDKPVRNLSTVQLNVTLGLTNASVAVGTAGQYPYVQTTTTCVNNTNPASFNTTCYGTVEGSRGVAGGISLKYRTDGECDKFQSKAVDCDVNYYASTDASNAVGDFISGLGIFATFLGVVVIGLLGYSLFTMFNSGRKEL